VGPRTILDAVVKVVKAECILPPGYVPNRRGPQRPGRKIEAPCSLFQERHEICGKQGISERQWDTFTKHPNYLLVHMVKLNLSL